MNEPEVDLRSAFQLGTEVVTESFADETIAVNLASGRYYSIDPTGGDALQLLVSGPALGDVAAFLTTRYQPGPESIESTLTGFVQQLITEGLVASTAVDDAATLPEAAASVGITFAPVLVVFSDMEDLLVLDPIHDVDATGWPVRRGRDGP